VKDIKILTHLKELLESREKSRRNLTWFCKKPTMKTLSSCEAITSSYKKLPYEYPIAICSGRSKLKNLKVLNNKFVAVSTCTDDTYSMMPTSKHDDKLIKVEEEMYELDQALNLSNLAITDLRQYNQTSQDSKPKIKKLTISWIRRMYNKNTKLISLLQTHPEKAVPVILGTLEQYSESVAAKKMSMRPIWKEAIGKHYKRSLDRKSIGFQRTDKGFMTHKEFLKQLKGKRVTLKEFDAGKYAQYHSYKEKMPHLQLKFDDLE